MNARHYLISFFYSLPIRMKLLVIIIGVCTGALFLSAILETGFNWTGERRLLMSQLTSTADMLALQSKATLEFQDPTAARENLAALRANSTIVKACLYDETGKVFAFYSPQPAEESICPQAAAPGDMERWDYLAQFRTIAQNNHKTGTIYIERSLDDMYRRFRDQILYKLVIVLFVIALIWPMSAFFQRMISRPVIQLAAITRIFSRDRNQQVKAIKTGNDEIGELVDSFNVMMEEIRRNERQLGKAIAELTRSNTELERFAHICSHDLQEPLRMVSNYTALLERKIGNMLDADTRQYLFFITDGATRMRELINDILAYSRIGHQLEAPQKVDLNAVIDYVQQNLNAVITERHAIIHVEPLPEITGNRTLMVQIFQNLISNAVKFSRSKPEVHVNAKRDADAWEFSVKDNGIGIDAKYHDKIFEIFRRLNRREEFQGTGIGLAIFKKAVEYHGGRVWVDSEMGKGTTFFFTIPDYETSVQLMKDK